MRKHSAHRDLLTVCVLLALVTVGCSSPLEPPMTSPSDNSPPKPPKTGPPLSFTTVSSGVGITCGVTTSGAAYCWGDNTFGGLGNGANSATTPYSTVPVAVSGALTFAMVSVGEWFTCGLTTAGAGYCWGSNFGGEFGDGGINSSPTPVPVSGGLTFATVTAGYSQTCGVTTGGKAYCWGDNSYDEVGNNSADSTITTPAPVSGGLAFARLSAGNIHTCGVDAGGVAYCWGANYSGQLGNNATTNSPIPVLVSGGLKFGSVSAGTDLTCGVTSGGAAYCWGLNLDGVLGIGTTTGPQQCGSDPCSTTPVAVSGGLTFATVSTGEGGWHNCGVTTSGAAYCWGDNLRGELGTGTTTSSTTPVAVSGGLTFREVSAGYRHTCGVTTDNVAYCWGRNSDGEIGNGTGTDALSPTAVLGPLAP
jgi:alpha-tubulin suppressor-like RCC1 family protein